MSNYPSTSFPPPPHPATPTSSSHSAQPPSGRASNSKLLADASRRAPPTKTAKSYLTTAELASRLDRALHGGYDQTPTHQRPGTGVGVSESSKPAVRDGGGGRREPPRRRNDDGEKGRERGQEQVAGGRGGTRSGSANSPPSVPDWLEPVHNELTALREERKRDEDDTLSEAGLATLKKVVPVVEWRTKADGLHRPRLFWQEVASYIGMHVDLLLLDVANACPPPKPASRPPPSTAVLSSTSPTTPSGAPFSLTTATSATTPTASAPTTREELMAALVRGKKPNGAPSAAGAGVAAVRALPEQASVVAGDAQNSSKEGVPPAQGSSTGERQKGSKKGKGVAGPQVPTSRDEVQASKPATATQQQSKKAPAAPKQPPHARSLLPFAPEELDETNSITWREHRITFPDDPEADVSMLSDRPKEEQVAALQGLAKTNENDQHLFHHAALPSTADFAPDTLLSTSIPNSFLSTTTDLALQPIRATALTRQILRGETDYVEELGYSIECSVRGKIGSDAWIRFRDSAKVKKMVAERSRTRDFERFKKGQDEMVEKGLWEGEWRSLVRYNGRMERFEAATPGREKEDVIRPLQHFHTLRAKRGLSAHAVFLQLVQVFRENHPDLEVLTTVVFVGDGKAFPSGMGVEPSQRGEAYVAISRWTGLDFGGACKISGGKVDMLKSQLDALHALPPTLLLSTLTLIPTFPLSITGLLLDRFLPSFTVAAAIKGMFLAMAAEEEKRNDLNEQAEKQRHGRKKGPRGPSRFSTTTAAQAATGAGQRATGTGAGFVFASNGAAAPAIAASDAQAAAVAHSLQPVPPMPSPAATATLLPFRQHPLFSDLCSMVHQSFVLGSIVAAVSSETLLEGVRVEFLRVAAQERYENGRDISLILVQPNKLCRARLQVYTEARGEATMWWDRVEGKLRVSQGGKDVWYWRKAEDSGRKMRWTAEEVRDLRLLHVKKLLVDSQEVKDANAALLTMLVYLSPFRFSVVVACTFNL